MSSIALNADLNFWFLKESKNQKTEEVKDEEDGEGVSGGGGRGSGRGGGVGRVKEEDDLQQH